MRNDRKKVGNSSGGILSRLGRKRSLDKKVDAGLRKKSLVREYGEAIIIAVILALFLRTFVVQAFKIPSGSMLPTLKIGDHILVNKFIYWFVDPQRGDIVVFKFPQDEKRDFIKRIIGLPGETVEIKNKQVFINDRPLKEDYIIYEDRSYQSGMVSSRDNLGPVKVPESHLFLMGDNRDNSMDSRYWGFLDESKIRGKAFIIYWSWNGPERTVRWGRLGNILH